MKIHYPNPSKNAPFFPGSAVWDETRLGGCNALTISGRRGILALGMALIVFGFTPGTIISARAADSVSDHISKAASKVADAVKDAGESARNGLEKFWNRIDEKRIKNRTPDQIVAWVIMGLLVGGLIQRFSNLNWFATLLLGLTGAFIGGIA